MPIRRDQVPDAQFDLNNFEQASRGFQGATIIGKVEGRKDGVFQATSGRLRLEYDVEP